MFKFIYIFLLFVCLFCSTSIDATNVDNANKAYKEKRYQQAIKDYELLLRTQRTASLITIWGMHIIVQEIILKLS